MTTITEAKTISRVFTIEDDRDWYLSPSPDRLLVCEGKLTKVFGKDLGPWVRITVSDQPIKHPEAKLMVRGWDSCLRFPSKWFGRLFSPKYYATTRVRVFLHSQFDLWKKLWILVESVQPVDTWESPSE